MKDFFDYKKPALWITATLAAACVVPAVLVLRNSKRSLKRLLGRIYRVEKVIYQAPFYSFEHKQGEAPLFRLTDSCELLEMARGEEAWVSLGLLEGLALDQGNFDDLFVTGRERAIARLRRNNCRAWRIGRVQDPVFYYFLQQRRGDLYLAQGYRADGLEASESKASVIRYLLALRPVDSE